MPELPDLEVVKEVLNRRIVGRIVENVELIDPVMLRRPTEATFCTELQGKAVQECRRYGKFIEIHFRQLTRLFINPMLAGRLTLKLPSDRILVKTGFRLQLSGNLDLRYFDSRRMGKIYLLKENESTALIPTFDQQGPDALDSHLTLTVFKQRIKKFHALIKNVLVNQRFIAGVGNAFADEILFAAKINPFRTRRSLTHQEIEALYQAMNAVLKNAIAIISARSGNELKFEIRDFLEVHGKGHLPCPRCGTPISSVKAGIRVANFCRNCQV